MYDSLINHLELQNIILKSPFKDLKYGSIKLKIYEESITKIALYITTALHQNLCSSLLKLHHKNLFVNLFYEITLY